MGGTQVLLLSHNTSCLQAPHIQQFPSLVNASVCNDPQATCIILHPRTALTARGAKIQRAGNKQTLPGTNVHVSLCPKRDILTWPQVKSFPVDVTAAVC